MSDDEEDYMSDAFLAKCVQQDVRPGLKMSHASKRHHDLEKKRDETMEKVAEGKKNKLSAKEIEESKRNEGLGKSLDESNKGFAMLRKMGYRAGESLGKSKSGLVEPIKIEVKVDRLGLGREMAMKRIAETKAELRRRHQASRTKAAEKQREVSALEFRNALSRRNRAKQIENDLYRSQKTCHQLDVEKGFAEPAESWFWPSQSQITEDQEDLDEHTKRWDVPGRVGDVDCGASGSEEDEKIIEIEALEPSKNEVHREPSEFSLEEMLQILTDYLRSQYYYCLWCGITFRDSGEMMDSCPGSTKDDHEG